MQLITCHSGRLQSLLAQQLPPARHKTFATGLEALDALAPGGSFARGAIHELLSSDSSPAPLSLALLLAKSAAQHSIQNLKSKIQNGSALVWLDPHRRLYPPALATAGVDLSRLFILRPTNREQEIWSLAEVLRCRGVGAAVASMGKLSRVEARRLQLAAETGSSVGILLRPAGRISQTYAAATRWLVEPARGERTVQRWKIKLLHGHGGRIGQSVYLEKCRETNTVRATEQLADRAIETQVLRASA
jgi:protein ImuA